MLRLAAGRGRQTFKSFVSSVDAPCLLVPTQRRNIHKTKVVRNHGTADDVLASIPSTSQATPLQERENLRSILELAQTVQQQLRRSGDESHEESNEDAHSHSASVQSQWWSQSWAEVIKRNASVPAGVVSPQESKARLEISDKLQARLKTPKRMIASHASSSLLFNSRPQVLEQYIATGGGIRLGKVLEDLDSLAGDASYRHVLGRRPSPADGAPENPVFIVTASVDRLDLIEPLRADRDYRLNGMVIYVGTSSMEVLVTVEEVGGRAVLTGRFTMATRNAATGKAQSIPPLTIETDAERQLFAQGRSHKERKQHEGRVSLERVPPTSQEAELLHSLWLSTQGENARSGTDNPERSVDIEDTITTTIQKMHPQQRNVNLKVFGGFLMRSAYELAFMNASIFARGHMVSFLSLDALSFHLPVSIGSLVSLTSRIVYTSRSAAGQAPPHDQDRKDGVASVVVLAEVLDPETGTRHKSNTFHFSFDIGACARRVLPESYRDSLAFIEGKRRVDLGNELRQIFRNS